MPAVPPLKRLRSKLGLSQAQVAEKVGVSQPNYQRWESGAAPIPKDKVKKLAKVLHSTVEVLTGATRYSRAGIALVSGDDGYWGEVAIHFGSGSEPIVASISAAEAARLARAFQDNANAFIEVIGLCNEHYLIRRSAISEAYLSDEAADQFGPPGVQYEFIPIHIVDDRLWDVLTSVFLELEMIDEDYPEEDIVEALSYFMKPSEIAQYLPELQANNLPDNSPTALESVDRIMAEQLGIPAGGVAEEEDSDDLVFRRRTLLSRAAETVVRLGPCVERRFVLHEAGDLSENHEMLVSLEEGACGTVAFTFEDVQTAIFRSDSLEFVRFPKHYLARALDGNNLNVYGPSRGEED